MRQKFLSHEASLLVGNVDNKNKKMYDLWQEIIVLENYKAAEEYSD